MCFVGMVDRTDGSISGSRVIQSAKIPLHESLAVFLHRISIFPPALLFSPISWTSAWQLTFLALSLGCFRGDGVQMGTFCPCLFSADVESEIEHKNLPLIARACSLNDLHGFHIQGYNVTRSELTVYKRENPWCSAILDDNLCHQFHISRCALDEMMLITSPPVTKGVPDVICNPKRRTDVHPRPCEGAA